MAGPLPRKRLELAAQEGLAALRGGRQPPDRQQVNRLVERFVAARNDPRVVVLEGFHPLKHALRFGARVEVVAAALDGDLAELVGDHCPELAQPIAAATVWLERRDYRRMGPYEPHTGVVSIAARPDYAISQLAAPRELPVVALEDPRHRGNLGAVVRVAAAAGAAGVVTLGGVEPWHPTTVRGSAGLHFALPVVAGDLQQLAGLERPLYALDPEGEPFAPSDVEPGATLVFGSERIGLSAQVRAMARARLALPMREGVSSLNLATAVAAVLYSLRLCCGPASRSAPAPAP